MNKFKDYRDNALKVKDKFTGFQGVITGHADYATGCDQYLVQPTVGEKNEWKESRWFDENRLELVEKSEPFIVGSGVGLNDNGADTPAPIK